MVHVSESADDQPTLDISCRAAVPEPRDNRAHGLLEVETLTQVKNGSETNFGIGDAIRGEIFGLFPGYTVQAFLILHDGGGHRKTLQIKREIAPIGAAVEPGFKLVGVPRRDFYLLFIRELYDGSRTQAPIEMIVKQHFG